MIEVYSTGTELKVIRSGETSLYSFSSFKSISRFQANNGNQVIVITFCTDAAGNIPVRLSLNEISNQPSWTNDVDGAEQSIKDLSTWISAWFVLLGSINSNIDDVEAYLAQILSAIQSGSDYEAALVLDAANVTWLEVRIYNPSTGTWDAPLYYQAGSNIPGTPTDPITYINPNSYLSQLVINTTSATRTPGLIRVTGAGTIAPLVYDFSVSNVGSANGSIIGGTIKPGETLNWGAGALNNSYAAGTISYDGTGTELVIIYNS